MHISVRQLSPRCIRLPLCLHLARLVLSLCPLRAQRAWTPCMRQCLLLSDGLLLSTHVLLVGLATLPLLLVGVCLLQGRPGLGLDRLLLLDRWSCSRRRIQRCTICTSPWTLRAAPVGTQSPQDGILDRCSRAWGEAQRMRR